MNYKFKFTNNILALLKDNCIVIETIQRIINNNTYSEDNIKLIKEVEDYLLEIGYIMHQYKDNNETFTWYTHRTGITIYYSAKNKDDLALYNSFRILETYTSEIIFEIIIREAEDNSNRNISATSFNFSGNSIDNPYIICSGRMESYLCDYQEELEYNEKKRHEAELEEVRRKETVAEEEKKHDIPLHAQMKGQSMGTIAGPPPISNLNLNNFSGPSDFIKPHDCFGNLNDKEN